MKTNLYVLPVATTTDERIQSQIDTFRREMLSQDVSLDHIESLISIIIEYLSEFEADPMLEQAYVKLNESFFWLSSIDTDIS